MSVKAHLTLEEFLARPQEKPYAEYLFGRVVEKAMPKRSHSLLQSNLAHLLWTWVEGGAGGEVLTEPRCILSTSAERHVQLPDVAWFSVRAPVDESDNVVAPPDLAVEILSPDDPFGRVQQKIRVYLRAGVRVVWIVDPATRTVSVCRRSEEPTLAAVGDVLEDALLPGLRLSLEDLFRPVVS